MQRNLFKILVFMMTPGLTKTMENKVDFFEPSYSLNSINSSINVGYKLDFSASAIFQAKEGSEKNTQHLKQLSEIIEDVINNKLEEELGHLFINHRNIVALFPKQQPALSIKFKMFIQATPKDTPGDYRLDVNTTYEPFYTIKTSMHKEELEQFGQFKNKLKEIMYQLSERLKIPILSHIVLQEEEPSLVLDLNLFTVRG